METYITKPPVYENGDNERAQLLEDIARLFAKKERQELTLENLTEAFKIDLPIFEAKIAADKKALISNESEKALLNQFVFDYSGKRTTDAETKNKRDKYDALDLKSIQIRREIKEFQNKIDAKKGDINDVIRGINYIIGLIGEKQEQVRLLEEK